MMRVVAAMLAFLATGFTYLYGQDIPGNVLSKSFKDEGDIYHGVCNQSGSQIVVQFEALIKCVDALTGKELWSRPYEGDEKVVKGMIHWRSNDEVIVPSNTSLLFVESFTGKIKDSVPYNKCLLEDFPYSLYSNDSYDDLEPRVRGNVMIIPQESTFDLVDLKNRKLLYRSSYEAQKQRAVYSGDYVLLAAEADTNVVLDIRKPSVVAKLATKGSEVDADFFQPFVAYGNYGFVIHEESGSAIDFTTGKVTRVPFRSSDIVSFGALIPGGILKILLQTENYLAMLNTQTGKFDWKRTMDADEYGTMMLPYHHSETSALVSFQNSDNHLFLEGLSYANGSTTFRKRMMVSTEDWEPKYKVSDYTPSVMSVVLQSIAASAANMNRNPGYNPGEFRYRAPGNPNPLVRGRPHFLDSLGFHTYWSQRISDTTVTPGPEKFIELINETCINWRSSAFAMVVPYGFVGGKFRVATLGTGQRAWKDKISESEDNAEAIHTMNPSTGAIEETFLLPGVKNSDYKVDFLGLRMPVQYEHGLATVGLHNVAYIKNDGTIDTTGFRTDSLKVVDIGRNYLAIAYIDENENHYRWTLEFDKSGIKRRLRSFSVENVELDYGADTTIVPYSLVLRDGSVSVLPVQSVVPTKWPSADHVITADQVNDADVGDLDLIRCGIVPLEDRLILIGDEGAAEYHFGLKKLTSLAIDDFNWKYTIIKGICRVGLTGLLVDRGGPVSLIQLNKTSPSMVLSRIEADRDEVVVVYSADSGRVIHLNPSN
jgi:hypothetical protein